MTAPEPRPAGVDGNARGLIVIVVAVAVGILLLWNANDGGGGGQEASSSSGGTSATTTSTLIDETDLEATTTTTAAETGREPSEVEVIVLNGSGQTGAAGEASTTLGDAGYQMATPGNAAPATTTTIYYAEGYQPEAIAVASKLGKGTDSVAPLSDASLGGAEGSANVVVVLGADTPPVDSGSGTGSSTTSTTSATGN